MCGIVAAAGLLTAEEKKSSSSSSFSTLFVVGTKHGIAGVSVNGDVLVSKAVGTPMICSPEAHRARLHG